MKTYLIKADIGEGYPYYTFMLVSKDLKEATRKAKKIIKSDYSEQFEYTDIDVIEVRTIADVKNRLVI